MHRNRRRNRLGTIATIAVIGSVLLPMAAAAQDVPGDGPTGPVDAVVDGLDGVDAGAPMVAPAGSDLPIGFLDGIPVGGPEDVTAGEPDLAEAPTDAPAAMRSMSTSSVTRRHIGDGVWNSIVWAAATAARPCTVSTDDVAAMMVAPIFKESSAATTPSTAGSPMTLSRADEWTSGVRNTNSNLNGNYGLYEAENPNTPYQRAYWHPGIGIWQYDSAGVGAPFTAVERMDINVVGADVARGMITRYCNSSQTTAFGKRRSAWSPWLTACTTSVAANNLCEQEFQAIRTNSSYLVKVPGISATGGAIRRTCTVGGEALECWYVDADRAEGATTWRFNPSGGPDWRTRPTPLSLPFYVVERNGYEERHWLKADTGYPVDISARRLLGKNARPRSGAVNAGSGLTWSRSTTLCDVTESRGVCGGSGGPQPEQNFPIAPSGVSQRSINVSGTYDPVVLDLNGDGRDDILWYGPGAANDSLWIATGAGTYRFVGVNIAGYYDIHVLDIDGDGLEDLILVPHDDVRVRIWRSRGDGTFASSIVNRPVGAEPLIVDRGGRGKDEILWYGSGALGDAWWTWNGSGITIGAISVVGIHRPVVGDFDGNGTDDIFWYNTVGDRSSVWLHRAAGGRVIVPHTVGNDYRPSVGDFDGDGRDDILWYQPGSVGEAVWFGAHLGAFASQSFIVNDVYRPLIVDLHNDGRDDILWYDETGSNDLWTTWSAGRSRSSSSIEIDTGYEPLVGSFGSPGRDGIFWYGPGALGDGIWHS